MLLLFLFAVILTVCGEKVKYNGYSVLRMQINNTNLHDILNIVETFNLDVWGQNALEEWMEIMIPPNQVISKSLKQHDHVIRIEDVEEFIQSTQNENVTKRQVFFDHFPTWEEANIWLNAIEDVYPDNTERFMVGRTSEGREIRGIKIFVSGQTKRAVFLQGGIHAREWITVTSTLYIIQQLLVQNTLINDFDFYIVPIFNIDGYIYTHDFERLWRKNRQLNSGSTCIGTDLNRNYQYGWGREGSSNNPCSDTFRGLSFESSPEVRAISTYISSVNNLVYFLDVHCCGSMFMSAWGFTTDLPTDYGEMLPVMQEAQKGIESVNGNTYSIGTSARVIYISSGGSVDWVYGGAGVIQSFTLEAVGSFVAPISSILPIAQEIYSGVIASVGSLVSK